MNSISYTVNDLDDVTGAFLHTDSESSEKASLKNLISGFYIKLNNRELEESLPSSFIPEAGNYMIFAWINNMDFTGQVTFEQILKYYQKNEVVDLMAENSSIKQKLPYLTDGDLEKYRSYY